MPIDAERVQAVFAAAVEATDPAQQAAILDRECAADAALRFRVEALLQAHRDPASILDRPAVASPTAAADSPPLFPTCDLSFLAPAHTPGALGRIGHYEVLEVLGCGGFGIVLRATDEVLQRVVAVKVLAPRMAATSPARKRFLREARAYARIRHDNVVQVHAVEEQPLPYLVMEYIPGGTLQQLLDRLGPLDAADVVGLGRQIAEGLAAAHATGLIHRDVKPANVLIEEGPTRRVKLTDFGLARAADDASISYSGLVAGTPLYMSPEQARGETLDHRSDLFSLGSVLYVMCTGRPPFRANASLSILKRVCDDTPRPIREVIPEAPARLCALIERLHAKHPGARFQSAREVADQLRDYQAGSAAHALAARRPGNRRRLALAVGAAVVLAGVLVLAALWWANRPPEQDGAAPPGGADTRTPPKILAPRKGTAARLPQPGRASSPVQDRKGKWLAIGCEDEVVLFDAATMEPALYLGPAAGPIYSLSFSPDGKLLATASRWGEPAAVVWDVATRRRTLKLDHQGGCPTIQFSPDGARLLTVGEDHRPTVWDARSGMVLHRFPAQDRPVCYDATFTADGKQVVTHVGEGSIRVWDATTWAEVVTLEGPDRVTEDFDVWRHLPLAVSADGKWLAAGSESGFKVWATADWKEQSGRPTPATWLAFAPDGRTLLTAAHANADDVWHSVTRWETATGRRVRRGELGSRGTWAVYYLSIDGKTLYGMACDPGEPCIHLYDAETLAEYFLPGMTPNGKRER
jgi:hypothetical protein